MAQSSTASPSFLGAVDRIQPKLQLVESAMRELSPRGCLLVAVWAPLVGLARVSMGVHYLSDILVGIAIGVVMGLVVLGLF